MFRTFGYMGRNTTLPRSVKNSDLFFCGLRIKVSLDGMILPGVTRDSVLSLTRSHAAGTLRIPKLTSKLSVSERGVTMKEVCEAAQSGRLVEMFGAGEFVILFFEFILHSTYKARLRSSAPLIRSGIKDRTWIFLWRKMEWARSPDRSGLN